jgi:hypothetical protein
MTIVVQQTLLITGRKKENKKIQQSDFLLIQALGRKIQV